jgi:hypothetical protein
MDYLDRELMDYHNDQAQQCGICFEYCDDSWVCNCCHDCEKESCSCDDEYESILGV